MLRLCGIVRQHNKLVRVPRQRPTFYLNKDMEHIKTKIYTLPEMRHSLKPLWSAWVLVAIGIVGCYFLFSVQNLSAGLSSTLAGLAIVGAVSLVTVLCYYLFGDSRRPYDRELHERLEPTYAYYPASAREQLIAALESKDEKALEGIKRTAQPEIILVRYSDKAETVYYSQLLLAEGKRHAEPLTGIIENKTQK